MSNDTNTHSFRLLWGYLDFEDRYNLMIVDEHFNNLSIIEWRRENLLILSYVQGIDKSDRLGLSIINLTF